MVGVYLPGLEGEGVETAGSANFIGCAETGLTGFDGLTAGADKPKRSGCWLVVTGGVARAADVAVPLVVPLWKIVFLSGIITVCHLPVLQTLPNVASLQQ